MTLSSLIILCMVNGAMANDAKDHWTKNFAAYWSLPSSGPQEILNFGGPDQFGCYFIDSEDSARNAPQYNWIDISMVGDTLYFLDDDRTIGPYNLNFPFPFYGRQYSQFRACSNGWISFTSNVSNYLNQPFPTADEPNNLIAPFWDDLTSDTLSRAYFYANSVDTAIFAWHNMRRYSDQGNYTFEIIFTSDGNLVFQYQSVSGVLNSHSIGIENDEGTIGLQYLHNAQTDESGKAILFSLTPPLYADHDVLPTVFKSPGEIGMVGDTIAPRVRFYNAGDSTESFSVGARIYHDGEVYNHFSTVNNLAPQRFTDVIFPVLAPSDDGEYEIIAVSELTGDEVVGNDTSRMVYTAFNNIYFNDFEADSGAFLPNHDWEWGVPQIRPDHSHSGIKLWGTRLGANYNVGPLLSTLVADTLMLDSNAVLTFWHWYDIEALFDGGNVKLSTDEGYSWNILQPRDGYNGIISNAFGNPLGGEPAFYGNSPIWTMESFDLSDYVGRAAIIKFDFGSDNSGNARGWYIDDFQVIGSREALPGWISGTVSDSTSHAHLAGASVEAGVRSYLTDTNGVFIFEVMPGIYSVEASAPFYNSLRQDSIVIASGDTATIDFSLPSPGISVDTMSIDTSLAQGESASIIRTISNDGNGNLNFRVRLVLGERTAASRAMKDRSTSDISDPPFEPLDFGDEAATFDPQTPTGDDNCLGVEFDGLHFWVTGRHISDDNHKLYKFDRNGVFLEAFDQHTRSMWGWRDLAWDGEFLYASDEFEIAMIDTSNGQKVGEVSIPSPIPPPVRALAYDPRTGHFWGANNTSEIVEFERGGQTMHAFSSAGHHIYGLAWDDASPNGPWLWVFSQDGDPQMQISQFDPRVGEFTGVEFYAIDHNGGDSDLAGGACFTTQYDSTRGVFFGLVMGRTTVFDSYDLVQGYEIAPYRRWITVEPPTGDIAPGSSLDLNIALNFNDSSFVADSLYSAVIYIENNSPNVPVIPVNIGFVSGTDENISNLPKQFALYQNYPNPFNSSTMIRFALPERADVKLEIYNILGQRIDIIRDEPMNAGYHSLAWDAARLSSGVYFYRLSAGKFAKVEKLLLLK